MGYFSPHVRTTCLVWPVVPFSCWLVVRMLRASCLVMVCVVRLMLGLVVSENCVVNCEVMMLGIVVWSLKLCCYCLCRLVSWLWLVRACACCLCSVWVRLTVLVRRRLVWFSVVRVLVRLVAPCSALVCLITLVRCPLVLVMLIRLYAMLWISVSVWVCLIWVLCVALVVLWVLCVDVLVIRVRISVDRNVLRCVVCEEFRI